MYILILNIVNISLFVKIITKIHVKNRFIKTGLFKPVFRVVFCNYFNDYRLIYIQYTIFSFKLCRIKFSTILCLLYEKNDTDIDRFMYKNRSNSLTDLVSIYRFLGMTEKQLINNSIWIHMLNIVLFLNCQSIWNSPIKFSIKKDFHYVIIIYFE